MYITNIYRNDKEGREQRHDDGQKPATKLAASSSSTRTAAPRVSGYVSDSRKETEIATLLLRQPV